MKQKVINIVCALAIGDYRLRLSFDDGTEQVVDFEPFLLHSVHPDIRAWMLPNKFSEFRIEYGELVWGDYELVIPTIDLYRNSINHHTPMDKVA